jgi:phosphohistidine phosphatase
VVSTTRRLILLRHAAAEPQGLDSADFERPLSPAGRTEAEIAARRLAELPIRPALALTSPARRSRATAEVIAHRLGLGRAALLEDASLYLASLPALRTAIARVPPEVGCLLLIGHNPGLSGLATLLDTPGRPCVLATGGFVHFDLPLDDWRLP